MARRSYFIETKRLADSRGGNSALDRRMNVVKLLAEGHYDEAFHTHSSSRHKIIDWPLEI
jgi:hypothetical protein